MDDRAWEAFAAAVQLVERLRFEVTAAKARVPDLPAWPWRVSKSGNLLRSDNVIVLRGGPGNRTQRRARLRSLLLAVEGYRDARLAEVMLAEQSYERVRPAEPGTLFGVPVDDITRMSAAAVADAMNRSAQFAGCAHVITPTCVRITFGEFAYEGSNGRL